ncbi:hypothetical protein KI387_022674, partial [Taxus chinensis]
GGWTMVTSAFVSCRKVFDLGFPLSALLIKPLTLDLKIGRNNKDNQISRWTSAGPMMKEI